jgi:ABC-type glycerol-3-phosphate transport system substrate-binding protein
VQKYYGQLPDVRSDVFLHAPEYGYPTDALWQSPASTQADNMISTAFADVTKGNKTVQAVLAELKPQLQAMLDQYRDQ